jgi:hypothetical protein
MTQANTAPPTLQKPNALSPEMIATMYADMLRMIDRINGPKPTNTSDAEWADFVDRNKQHFRIMLEKDFWTTEDLEPIRRAAA